MKDLAYTPSLSSLLKPPPTPVSLKPYTPTSSGKRGSITSSASVLIPNTPRALRL
ncbi:MAG TPA: hypothetical protein VFV86_10235 [Nitrososphaeraceae archaeon]|nr:hypothetical protein [Nitrososphaeraceae archaeon]